jgi:pimeloyl-ACP methyl ester carboxylesterase
MTNKTVDVQGIPIYVTERGSGPPVVLLHGNPDSPSPSTSPNAHRPSTLD